MALIDHIPTRSAPAPRQISIRSFLALWRSRRALAKLDARALDDIGITSEAAQIEARRGVWDVPETWKN